MQLSPIQNQIISRLKNADTLRHRDIRPIDISTDLYNYHLKFLLQKGLVVKTSIGYKLSESGQQFVADIHHTSDESQRLFKINVITIVSRKNGGSIEILTQRRTSRPSYGKIGVMGGTILKGEGLLDGAKRKLQQETGLSADFRLLGFERRFTYADNTLFSDVLFPICYSESYTGMLVDTEFGENFWTPIEQAIKNEQDPHDSIAALAKVLELINAGEIDSLPSFYSETTQQR